MLRGKLERWGVNEKKAKMKYKEIIEVELSSNNLRST